MPKEPTHKPKQTRKRIPRTCAQCRKRKQKCDSLKPCAVCKLRGEADLCDYEGAQPTRVLDEDDVISAPISPAEIKRLREQLDGLEALVSSVVQKRPGADSLGPEADSPRVDLEEYNVAATLTSIMVSRAVPSEIGQDPPIVEKVRRHCRSSITAPSTWAQISHNPGTLLSYFTSPASSEQIADLQRQLPTYEQVQHFLKIYVREFAWYHSCFNHRAYESEAHKLYHHRDAEGHELEDSSSAYRLITMATTYAIARMSIMKLTFQESTQLKLPLSLADRTNLSKQYLDASVACLKCADFESSPKIEAVVCLIIILEALWFDERFGGLEDLGALFELKCKAMTLAFDLALHRDPAHRDPSRGSQLESDKAHERRVLWWALMSIDGLYSGPGRMSSINGLEAVDVFLPALGSNSSPEDIHEGCPAGCTASNPLTGIKPRLLMGYVGHEIDRLPLRRNPMPTINDVLQAHRDLASLEAHLHESHKIFFKGHIADRSRLPKCSRARRDAIYFYARYHFLVVKLHRPMHTVKRDETQQSSPPFDIAYHRKFVIDHALLLLDLRRISNPSPDYLDGNMMALSASFSLALDYLFDPQTEEAPYIKDELEQFVAFLKHSRSPLLLKGLDILQCVMGTWGTPPPPGTTWFVAFEGPVSPTSWIQGPFHQPLDLNYASSAAVNSLGGFGNGNNPAFSSLRVFQNIDFPESPLLPPHSAHQLSQSWAQAQDSAAQSLNLSNRKVSSIIDQVSNAPSTSSIVSHHTMPASLSQYHSQSVDQCSPSASTNSLPHPHQRQHLHRYSLPSHSLQDPQSTRFFPTHGSNNDHHAFNQQFKPPQVMSHNNKIHPQQRTQHQSFSHPTQSFSSLQNPDPAYQISSWPER